MPDILTLPNLAKKNESQSIRQLFENSGQIRIPAYQRAYSWEHKQCAQFLDDLVEQQGRKYYLGQILFEHEDEVLYIIDGQQRLTTTVIFLSALVRIFELRGSESPGIKSVYLTDVFETIEDDQTIFKKITRKHLVSSTEDTETISQRRIIEAFTYFRDELDKLDVPTLETIGTTLENAVISTFFIASKIEATQVFEYQNNRGKELSRFEVIKAYLMHQIHLQSTNVKQANKDIAQVQQKMSRIYRYIEGVEGYFSENELLDNYCALFYNMPASVDAIKQHIARAQQQDRTAWIVLFFENLVDFCQSAKSVFNAKGRPEISNLFFIGTEVNWKLVLLSMFYKGEVSGDLVSRIFKLLEILCFKLKLGDYRTDYLYKYTRRYFDPAENYSLEDLYGDIRNSAEFGFKDYWNHNGHFKNIITTHFEVNKHHYSKRKAIKFILWQYENEQRINNRSGLLLDKDLYDSYTIEHICPQHPDGIVYSDIFKAEHLHRAGNLALLTQSQNSRFGNKSFDQKLELFQDTALSSYTEIRHKLTWTELEIGDRHENIARFVRRYFEIEYI
ncbi:DUF262 domain-containing HNH endonuclease family protein [Pedobacter psychrodurus]|uniref:DUF262 domain-containing protein n=1 Tax=Pedobacter psychrodurus TaxID=2530456 RepID=UPI0029316A4C|nr:DUF262 domain-containing HNH endonuclease family protein [Pedobacter psychrodurus]